MAKKKSTSKKRSTVKKTARRSERQYFAGRAISKNEKPKKVILTGRELDKAEDRAVYYDVLDMNDDNIPDGILTKRESDKASKRKTEGKIVSDIRMDRSLNPYISKDGKYYTRVYNYPTKAKAEQEAEKQLRKPEIQETLILPTRGGFALFVRYSTDESKVGYYIKGDRVYYRTKSGKEGSMPKGHLGMIKRWGLEEVEDL